MSVTSKSEQRRASLLSEKIAASMSGKTIFVVDDNPAARQSVTALVSSMGVDVEDYASAEEFLDRYDRSKFGCLILDVFMTGMTGFQLQERLTAEGIHLAVIIVTGFGDVPMAVRAMRTGAYVFLEKPFREEELWENIVQALEKKETQRRQDNHRTQISSRLITLSDEELEVMEKIVAGKPNKQIAADLDIGLRTAELRRANVLKKMQADSLAELVRMAHQIDFLPADVDE